MTSIKLFFQNKENRNLLIVLVVVLLIIASSLALTNKYSKDSNSSSIVCNNCDYQSSSDTTNSIDDKTSSDIADDVCKNTVTKWAVMYNDLNNNDEINNLLKYVSDPYGYDKNNFYSSYNPKEKTVLKSVPNDVILLKSILYSLEPFYVGSVTDFGYDFDTNTNDISKISCETLYKYFDNEDDQIDVSFVTDCNKYENSISFIKYITVSIDEGKEIILDKYRKNLDSYAGVTYFLLSDNDRYAIAASDSTVPILGYNITKKKIIENAKIIYGNNVKVAFQTETKFDVLEYVDYDFMYLYCNSNDDNCYIEPVVTSDSEYAFFEHDITKIDKSNNEIKIYEIAYTYESEWVTPYVGNMQGGIIIDRYTKCVDSDNNYDDDCQWDTDNDYDTCNNNNCPSSIYYVDNILSDSESKAYKVYIDDSKYRFDIAQNCELRIEEVYSTLLNEDNYSYIMKDGKKIYVHSLFQKYVSTFKKNIDGSYYWYSTEPINE